MQHSNLIIYNPKPLLNHPKPHQRNSPKRPNITPSQNTPNLLNNTQTTLNHNQTMLNTHISLHRKIPDTFNIHRLHAYMYMGLYMGIFWTKPICYVYTHISPIWGLFRGSESFSRAEMGSITFESNELHYHYIAFSSLPLPLHTFLKSNHYHYHYFGNVIITITHYFCPNIYKVHIGRNKLRIAWQHLNMWC